MSLLSATTTEFEFSLSKKSAVNTANINELNPCCLALRIISLLVLLSPYADCISFNLNGISFELLSIIVRLSSINAL